MGTSLGGSSGSASQIAHGPLQRLPLAKFAVAGASPNPILLSYRPRTDRSNPTMTSPARARKRTAAMVRTLLMSYGLAAPAAEWIALEIGRAAAMRATLRR